MTKYSTLTKKGNESKKTIFKYTVECNSPGSEPRIETTTMKPKEFKEVIYLGRDDAYGDVFLARPESPSVFWIFFGVKGDEFNS